jgi:CubicO group peptidase (beta-lactamase class C family)
MILEPTVDPASVGFDPARLARLDSHFASYEPIRVWHLLTRTSGLTYGFAQESVVDALYRNAGFDILPVPGQDLATQLLLREGEFDGGRLLGSRTVRFMTRNHYWGGLASTAFWVDPAEELTAMLFTQLVPSSIYPLRPQFRQLLYSALASRRATPADCPHRRERQRHHESLGTTRSPGRPAGAAPVCLGLHRRRLRGQR